MKYWTDMRKPAENLTNSTLKIIAAAAMLADHIAAFLLIPQGFSGPLITVMRLIGRISFPIYAYLIGEGYLHTSDRKKYGASLLIFALISEIPWNLANSGSIFYEKQNIFFTLFLGYLGICLFERHKADAVICTVYQAVMLAASLILKADYGPLGYALIMLLYILPIHSFNMKRGFINTQFLKYAFYAFYPVHLLALYFIRG